MGRREKVTREAVLQAAREAFAERGFEGTTLAAISARVGLSPAALLRHAPTKERLFQAALSAEDGNVELLPMAFLQSIPGTADPQKVLRRLAEDSIRYFEKQIGVELAKYLHGRSPREFRVPDFDRHMQVRFRGINIAIAYFRRACRAGRLKVRDPNAAALLFLGAVQAFVITQRLAKAYYPAVPLKRFLDTLFEIWTAGAISKDRPKP